MRDIFVEIERLVVDAPPGASLDPARLSALTEEALGRQLGLGAKRDSAAPGARDAGPAEEEAARQLARAVSDALGGRS